MRPAALLIFALITACGGAPTASSPEQTEVRDSRLNYQTKMDSDSGNAFGLQSVQFDYRSAVVDDEAKAKLLANVEVLKSHSNLVIQIEGHTDATAGVAYNLALGDQRAAAVQKFLVTHGIFRGRLSTVSYGKEQPLPGTHDSAQDRKNRRVNFVVTTLE
jgi:outer membrane protein OmpA-like peptidoglycan-associated protein